MDLKNVSVIVLHHHAVLAEYAYSLRNRVQYAHSDQTVCNTAIRCWGLSRGSTYICNLQCADRSKSHGVPGACKAGTMRT